jgi:2,4-dienoyl-CoA reductase-like NADH-dependent reductase (Old Yellow Enzyme family)
VTHLFDPLTLRGTTFRNRIGVAPMCQYAAADDARPTEWHLAHLLQRALGGAGLVCVEATGVEADGRITASCLGLWNDAQESSHARLAQAIARGGAVPGIQLAHAGRKASRRPTWQHGPADPGWEIKGPSAAGFGDYAVPQAMTPAEIEALPQVFADSARRAVRAGYGFVEVHGAHGYLLHQFLSPLSNLRNDAWGGDFAGRTRLLLDITDAVRAAIPDAMPLVVRLSHTDWVAGGWDTAETVALSRLLSAKGVDLISVTSGGVDHRQQIALKPLYQVPGAEAVRREAAVPVAAVGLITTPEEAEGIVAEGRADLVLLARAVLRDPYWPARAAIALGQSAAVVPPQYDRGWNAWGKLPVDLAIAEPMPAL